MNIGGGLLRRLRHALRCPAFIGALCALLWIPPAFADPADPTDPRIQALAASLGQNPIQIHAYLRDQIGIDIYAGSLRGARGTLASRAGNALDRASLGIALLRASGYAARYAQGTLASNDVHNLIGRALLNPLRALGCYNPFPIADVINDFQLNTEAQTHYWIEYAPTSAGPFTAMDPSFAGAALGQTFATAAQNFSSIPAALRHKVRIHLDVETFTQAAASFGLGLGSTTVLDQTLEIADIVDKPLTLGHFVNAFSPPALAIGATTNTYSPYLVVGGGATSPLDYQVLRGTDYTEIITNFPLGNVLVTGIFLNIDVTNSAGQTTTSQRTLADRVGYANRQAGGTTTVDTGSLTQPLLTELDLLTMSILPSRQPLDDFSARQTRLAGLQGQLAGMLAAVQALPAWNLQTPDQRALALNAISLNRATTIAVNELLVESFAGAADATGDRNARRLLVRNYFDSPRITIATAHPAAGTLGWSLDIHRNTQRLYAAPGVSFINTMNFNRTQGMSESMIEGNVLSQVTGGPVISIAAIFENSTDPLSFVPITPENPDLVDTLSLSPDAKARIAYAVRAGRSVVAPKAPVMVGGTPVTGWLETDPNTGYTVSTFENGLHGALVEYAFTLLESVTFDPVKDQLGGLIGRINAVGVFGVAFMSAVLQTIATSDPYSNLIQNLQATLAPILKGILKKVFDAIDDLGVLGVGIEGRASIVVSLVKGLKDGLDDLAKLFNADGGDPLVPTTLFALDNPPLPANQPPGAVPGVSVSMAVDPLYSIGVDGAEFHSVYKVQVTNTGPATDTFRFIPSGGIYQMLIPTPPLTIPAGATAEFHACLTIGNGLPAAGTQTPVSVTAQSTTGPTSNSANDTYSTALAAALALRVLPTPQRALAGTGGTATLTLDSLGNTTTPVNLTVTTSPGLQLSGVPASLILNIGESRSLPLTFTVAPGTPAGTTLEADIRGDFGGAFPVTAQFGVTVTSALTRCAAGGAIAAAKIGRDGLGSILSRLTIEVDQLAIAPANANQKQTVLGLLDNLVSQQLIAPYLAPFAAPVAASRTALAAAAPGGVGAVLTTLEATLCDLGTALAAAYSDAYYLRLNPSVVTNLPNLSTKVDVTIINSVPSPRAFNVGITGVPAGVTATFNTTRVVVPANYQTNSFASPVLNVTFSNTGGAVQAFAYQVTATPEDDPGTVKTAPGELTLRPEILRIVSVATAPGYGDAGTMIVPTARVLNSSNEARNSQSHPLYLSWVIRNRNGQVITFPSLPVQQDMAIGDNVVSVPLPAVNTTGYAPGPYTVEVTAFDNNVPIPGAVASGNFFVGSPLTAGLTVTPATVPSGDSAVTVALTVAKDLAAQPLMTLRSTGAMPSLTASFARSGTHLYVCQHDRVSVIDVSNPDAPAVVNTFATTLLANNYGNVTCQVNGTNLIVGYDLDDPSLTDYRKLVVFDIGGGNATAPVQVNPVPLDLGKRFGGPIVFNGTTGFMATTLYFYNPFSGFIFEMRGNLLELDFTTLSAPTLTGELFHHFSPADNNTVDAGGPNMQNAVILAGTTALLASATSTGDPTTGVGRLNVVDTTGLPGNCPGAPNPCITTTVDVAQARLLYGIGRQGSTAVMAGDTVGYYDGRSGLTGNLIVAAFDTATPSAPVLKSTLVTSLTHKESISCNPAQRATQTAVIPLTNNYYAVGAFNPASCHWVLALIDANDPLNLRVIPYDVTDPLKDVILNGSLLYALTETSVLVFDYVTILGPAITPKVTVPKGTGVALMPGSFNVPPTSIDSFSDHDVYTWVQPTTNPLTWQANITAMQPGTSRDVASGARVDFTVPGYGAGSLLLGPAAVTADQIVALAPANQLASIGAPVNVTVTLINPRPAPVTYALSVQGVPASWIKTLAPSVLVPANSQATTPLVMQTAIGDGSGTFPFRVVATAGAVSGSATAQFVNYFNPDIGTNQPPYAGSSTLVATPNPATGARNATTVIDFRISNTSTGNEQYYVFATAVPSGWTVTFDRDDIVVPSNAAIDLIARIGIPAGQAPGTFNVDFQQNANFALRTSISIPVTVSGAGVDVALTPGSGGTPSTTYSATITNRGLATDTFNLSALGALGIAATLGTQTVTLAPGAAQSVPVTLAQVGGFALPGNSSFEVQAVSQTSSAARARAVATVTVPPVKGLALAGQPQSKVVAAGASVQHVNLLLSNIGNAEDDYAVSITGTTGPATASLKTPQGATAQSIASMNLPGFGAASIPITVNLSASGAASVTVHAVSLTDGSKQGDLTFTFAQSFATLAIATASPLPSGVTGFPYAPVTLQATGGLVPYSNWVVTSGALPAGLQLNPASGVIDGKPTGATGTANFTVQVSDSGSATASKPFALDVQAPACIAPPSGLVSWWPAEGNAEDIRGASDGALQGDATFVPGKVGQAFSFSGTGYVAIPDADSLDMTTGVTLAAWIKPNQCPHGYCAIIAKSGSGGRAYGMWLTGPGSAFGEGVGAVHAQASGFNASGAFTPAGSVPDGVFTHVAAVITAGGDIKVYINGQPQTLTTIGGTPSLSANTAPLYIGNGDPGSNELFTGLIDEAQVFNRALSAGEIQSIVDIAGGTQCRAVLDIDADGRTDALTDGLLLVRYLLGRTGTLLTADALSPGATRTTDTAITDYLTQIRPMLDVDGNTQTDALTDGVLIMRYLFGLRGTALVQGATGGGATRTTQQIEDYIGGLR